MKKLFNIFNRLYLLTAPGIAGLTHSQIVHSAISAGVKTFQLREKCMTKRAIYAEALSIRKLTAENKAVFIVNDYIDIAMAVDADGVHLGQEDMPVEEARKIMGRNKIIGISTHNLKQALTAEKAGADYIGFGPVFYTKTKDAGSPRGIMALQEIRRHIKIPIVAIGGITPEKLNEVITAGAEAVAVASGILSGDICRNVREYLNKT